MLKRDFEVLEPSNRGVQDDTVQSSQMRQPLSHYILRPKPEPTDAYSPNKKMTGAFPDPLENNKLDSNAQFSSDQVFKPEQCTPVSPSDERCRSTIGAAKPRYVPDQGQRPHSCELCDRSFANKTNLRKHVDSVHFALRPYACEQCDKSFSQKIHMQSHLKSIHLKSCSVQFSKAATVCTDLFAGRSLIGSAVLVIVLVLVHFQLAYNPNCDWLCHSIHTTATASEPTTISPARCTASLPSVLLLGDATITNGQRPHSCELCDRSFAKKTTLRKHVDSVHFAGMWWRASITSRNRDETQCPS